jgi:hypothetical protein
MKTAGNVIATRTVMTTSSVIECLTGVGLLCVPGLVARVLLNADLSDSGVAVGRLAGLGLLSLGLACRPGQDQPGPQATFALFTYNLLAALYLGFLRASGDFVSYLLWPACGLHAILAILLARPAVVSLRK